MTIDLSGRVAIVTGAGRGIGREVALALARRGASVLVNDYGGGGSTLKPGGIEVAQNVVEEIAALGGRAVAEASSVGTGESAEAIVGKAMEAFGRIDVLVNNAGGNITTDIHALRDDQAEGIVRSNFTGGYMLLRKVWPQMMAQGFGRIVNIMSGAILGLHGRAAYAAGKAAYQGLTAVAATEGERHGIRTNGVWPTANTRLMAGIDDPDMIEMMKRFPPEQVAEPIVYFCSPECEANGEFFNVGGGKVSRIAYCEGSGFSDPDITAESLAANIDAARSLSDANVVGNR